MKRILEPLKSNQNLTGNITVPSDKSIAQRAIIFSSIAKGQTIINNFPLAGDPQSTLEAIQSLGINCVINNNQIIVNSNGVSSIQEPCKPVYTGNSGTGFRLITGLLAGLDSNIFTVLTGDESLSKRPMQRITKPLQQMGAQITGRKNCTLAPIAINSTQLNGGNIHMNIASAQLKSALLLAGLNAKESLVLHQPALSRDHTEIMLQQMGANIQSNNLDITLQPSELQACEINIPGDISSAAFLLVAGSIIPDSNITINNVGLNPSRAGIITVLEQMGADLQINQSKQNTAGECIGNITVKATQLKGIELSGDIIPNIIDEIPILCLAAARATGQTIIKDAKELRVKECDRLSAMAYILKGLNVEIEELEDGLIIQGNSNNLFNNQQDYIFDSYHDHRIAMTTAIASLLCQRNITLEGAEWADVSFPEFYNSIDNLKSA